MNNSHSFQAERPMYIFNTMSRTKEELETLQEGKVFIYSCGPTVYNLFHLGNARPFICFDILRRVLTQIGYEVKFVQNFTDIDDKVIRRANEEGINFEEIASRYIQEYYKDAGALAIQEADVHPRATDSIPAIIDIIAELLAKKHAYIASDGIYFDTASFSDYGKLSHYTLEDLQKGASNRLNIDQDKRNYTDFVLWKFKKENEPFWHSPWGDGRPGWHIECSAMIHEHLHDLIDIHCGGQDLIFPHHENEIAQSECACGHSFARYWMHNGFINVNHEKMSKSKNNFFMVRTLAENYPYSAIRYFMLSSHYRSPINFSDELLSAAQQALTRIQTSYEELNLFLQKSNIDSAIIKKACLTNFYLRSFNYTDDFKNRRLYETKFYYHLDLLRQDFRTLVADETQAEDLYAYVADLYNRFMNALCDDLNTSVALAVLFDLVKEVNILIASLKDLSDVQNINPGNYLFLLALNALFIIFADLLGIELLKQEEIPLEIIKLAQERFEAKSLKNWAKADELRKLIRNLGYEIKDQKDSYIIKRI